MTPLHRLACPTCGAALTDALRVVDEPAFVATNESQTWLLPASGVVFAGSPLYPEGLRKAARLAAIVAPQPRTRLALHADLQRTVGCCGLSYRSLEDANLLCARCGAEVGVGYEDCCGPYWAALFEHVEHVVEERSDPWPADTTTRLSQWRALLDERPPSRTAEEVHAEDCGVYVDDPATWQRATSVDRIRLDVEGPAADPILILEGPERLSVPVPFPVLARLLVLDDPPYATTEPSLPFQAPGGGSPDVNVACEGDQVLFDVASRTAHISWRIERSVWLGAWTELRGRVARVVHEGRGGYVELEGTRYPMEHVGEGRFEIHFPNGQRHARLAEHRAALERLVRIEKERFALAR